MGGEIAFVFFRVKRCLKYKLIKLCSNIDNFHLEVEILRIPLLVVVVAKVSCMSLLPLVNFVLINQAADSVICQGSVW